MLGRQLLKQPILTARRKSDVAGRSRIVLRQIGEKAALDAVDANGEIAITWMAENVATLACFSLFTLAMAGL